MAKTSSISVSLSLATLLAGLALAAEGRAQERYYPLDTGNFWRYTNDRFESEWINEVIDIDAAGVVTMTERISEITVRLQETGDDILIEIGEEGLVPAYRFGQDSWVHRDTSGCDDGRNAVIQSRIETVRTPAGEFTGCILVTYEPGVCADAGVFAEWFAPGVGLIRWTESNIAGEVVWELAEYGRDPGGTTFRRGDANSDDSLDIGDAVFTLQYLFTGGPDPECLKSADVNDDDVLELTDPVYELTFLFLGGLPPLAPFEACGVDPSPDENLTCESFAPCGEAFTGD